MIEEREFKIIDVDGEVFGVDINYLDEYAVVETAEQISFMLFDDFHFDCRLTDDDIINEMRFMLNNRVENKQFQILNQNRDKFGIDINYIYQYINVETEDGRIGLVQFAELDCRHNNQDIITEIRSMLYNDNIAFLW